MRNLKKFLALVLAMMMTLSLMVTVNAADEKFGDKDEIIAEFQDDVQVLTGMQIIRGWDGEFHPKDTVTRAEMAAFIYRLKTGDYSDRQDSLYVNVSSAFEDVQSTDWYAGYIGYCADARIMEGWEGKAHPEQPVTGYQALTMILRAMGVNEPGNNLSGGDYTVRAASMANSYGMLGTVNKSTYAGSLSDNATRELVAELVFQGATKPQVQWTNAFGYQQYGMVGGVLSYTRMNPSLGEQNYGLDSYTGIIVGNQQTGEKYTLLGLELNYKSATEQVLTGNGSYVYTDAAATSGVAGNVKLSFATPTGVDQFGHQVTIWYDSRTSGAKTAAVDTTTFDTQYSKVYTVIDKVTKTAVIYENGDQNLTTSTAALNKAVRGAGFSVGASTAYESDGFAAISSKVATAVAKTNGTSDAYLLISNSDPSNDVYPLDLIVDLEVSVDTIKAVNNYSSPKTVTHNTDPTEIYRSAPSAKDKDLLVYGEDDIVVSGDVVLNKIYGTGTEGISTLGTQAFYGINGLTKEKEGTITAISGDGTVTLKGGETLKMSALWNVTGGGSGATAGDGYGADIRLIGNTVTFILDGNGDYVDCYVPGNTTLAGAYAYWVQEPGSIDKITYYLQGVTRTGEMVTREITKDSYNTAIANKVDTAVEIHHMTSGTAGTAGQGSNVSIAAPGSNATGINGYKEYTINGANVVSETSSWTALPTGESWTAASKTVTGVSDFFGTDTRFHVVTGWGSTLEVKHYTGLEDLLQGAASIEVAGWYFTGPDDTEHIGSNNDAVTDVVIVRATRIQPASFLYSEKAITTGQIPTVDGKAHQLMLRVAGEKDETGILVANSDYPTVPGTAQTTAANKFYQYSVTPEGYYNITPDDMDGTKYGYTTAYALTNSGTAFGYIRESTTNKEIHAANAKVIDLTDHGIDSYIALRRAVEENSGIKVDVLLTSMGGDTASVIYVHTFA